MRIWVFSHYFPPEGNAPAARIHEMARRWVARGHQVTVITGPPSVPDGVVYPGYRNRLGREVIDGIDVVRVPVYLAANRGTLRRSLHFVSYMVAATLRALALPAADVIVATTPQFFCGWAGVLVSRLRRRPLVLEVRDLWPASIVAVGALRPGRILSALEALERRMYAAAAAIVTVGEGYADELRARGVASPRLTVITNGVDLELFSPRPARPGLLAAHGLDGRFVCAYVGTVGVSAGLSVLLEVAAELQRRGRDDLGLLVVGDGARRQGLAEEAQARGLDNLVFAGRQPKAAIPDYLASVAVCLVHLRRLPLFTTVLPSKIFEAMAMARPIVLGVEGHAARLVVETGAGITVIPEDPQAIVDALLRLADTPGLGAELGTRGRDAAIAAYNRDHLADRYLELLDAVITGAQGG